MRRGIHSLTSVFYYLGNVHPSTPEGFSACSFMAVDNAAGLIQDFTSAVEALGLTGVLRHDHLTTPHKGKALPTPAKRLDSRDGEAQLPFLPDSCLKPGAAREWFRPSRTRSSRATRTSTLDEHIAAPYLLARCSWLGCDNRVEAGFDWEPYRQSPGLSRLVQRGHRKLHNRAGHKRCSSLRNAETQKRCTKLAAANVRHNRQFKRGNVRQLNLVFLGFTNCRGRAEIPLLAYDFAK